MITKKEMHGCKCDNCGKEWIDEHRGIVAFTDESGIKEALNDDTDWYTDADKHYCPDCFDGFDDEDNLILKK